MLLYTRVKYAAEQSLYIMYEIISLLNDAIDQSECSIPKTCVLKLIFTSREEKPEFLTLLFAGKAIIGNYVNM